MAATATLSGALALLPARPVDAYMTECCAFPSAKAPNLIMAEWPNNPVDNSGWMQAAVVNGVGDWNSAPTRVYINVELYADGQDIEFYNPTMQSTTDKPSGGCEASNTNGQCIWALETLMEGCYGGYCAMTQNQPNYDEATVGHETGHALGLDHSCTAYTLMAGPNSNCSNGGAPYACTSESNCVTQPQQDDINGMNALYGTDNYQYGGCAGTKPPLALPVAPVPAASVPDMSVPPTPTVPPLPEQNVIYGTANQAETDARNPEGTATTAEGEALAATGKVGTLPIPHPGGVTVGGTTVNNPC